MLLLEAFGEQLPPVSLFVNSLSDAAAATAADGRSRGASACAGLGGDGGDKGASSHAPRHVAHDPLFADCLLGVPGQGAAEFLHPVGVAVDAARGVMFVADCWNHRLQAVELPESASGSLKLLWQHGVTGKAGTAASTHMYRPRGVATSANEPVLYVSDSYNHRIVALDSENGRFVRAFGGKGAQPAQFNTPWGLALGAQGLWIADASNHRVQCVRTSDGQFVRQVGLTGLTGESTAHLNYPVDVESWEGKIFVADQLNHRVQCFDEATGVFETTIGDGVAGARDGQLNLPQALCVDAAHGLLYVAECGNKRVSVFDLRRDDFPFCGLLRSNIVGDGASSGDPATAFDYPAGVCVDAVRNLVLVADFELNVVHAVHAEARILHRK